MLLVTYALTSEALVKDRMDITVATFDTLLKRMIYAATAFIEKECGSRRFQTTTYTDEIYDGSTRDGSRKEWILLKHSPVTVFTIFSYNVGSIGTPSWQTFNVEDYQRIDLEGIIRLFQRVPRGLQNIRITYTAGYLIDFDDPYDETKHTLPFDITELCERMVVRAFKKRTAEGKRIEGFESSTITWIEDLTKEDKQVIAFYRRLEF